MAADIKLARGSVRSDGDGMMRLPVGTHLGELRIRNIYEYYDGPRLFSCENTAEQLFLALSVEDLEEAARWVYCPVSNRRLTAIEGRSLDLRTAFSKSENGFVFDVTISGLGDSIVSVAVRELPESDLPLPNEYLDGEWAEQEQATSPIAPLHALQTRRETLRIALRTSGIAGFEAPSRLVGQALVGIQELVSAIAQAVGGAATTRGRLPPDILSATELRTVGAFAGSFGVELAAAQLSDLFGGSVMADSLESLDRLLGAGADDEQLAPILDELKPRVASEYRKFVELFADTRTGFTFDWGSVDGTRGSFRKMDAAALSGIAAALALVDTSDTTTYSVTGVLIGLNTRTRSFEIEDRIKRTRIGGRLDPARFDSDEEFTINGVYRATIEETIEVSGLTGDEAVTRVLVELAQADHLSD